MWVLLRMLLVARSYGNLGGRGGTTMHRQIRDRPLMPLRLRQYTKRVHIAGEFRAALGHANKDLEPQFQIGPSPPSLADALNSSTTTTFLFVLSYSRVGRITDRSGWPPSQIRRTSCRKRVRSQIFFEMRLHGLHNSFQQLQDRRCPGSGGAAVDALL